MTDKTYSMTPTQIIGDTHTSLDQLVSYIYADNGLAGANDAKDIASGFRRVAARDRPARQAAIPEKALQRPEKASTEAALPPKPAPCLDISIA